MSWEEGLSKSEEDAAKRRDREIRSLRRARDMLSGEFIRSLKRLSEKVSEEEYIEYEKKFDVILRELDVLVRNMIEGNVD